MTIKADLILHPVRMRILMALAGRQKTSRQLTEDLRDVPPATLYRHIRRLAEAGLIEVAEERQVRGTVEKVYTVDPHASILSAEEMGGVSKEEHLRYFTVFVASLLDDFSRYLEHTQEVNIATDVVGYNKFSLELSDQEIRALTAQVNQAFAPYLNNVPRPDRRRRIITSIIMPDLDVVR